jgi:succinyldiaminopimelate transaminase
MAGGFVPPPYPYDRLRDVIDVARGRFGEAVDLSIGTPCDPPPDAVVDALAHSNTERGYPPSIGSGAYREAAANWIERRFGVQIDVDAIAACVGTKELVAGIPHWLRLRTPDRDTVLYPSVSYPSYAMGASLAGGRAVAVPCDEQWSMRLDAIDPADAARALCLWVNSPGNPAGGLDDLMAAAEWGRRHGVLVLSDECYAEFTWDGRPRTILEAGSDGVVAVHSLSKRSNLAGARAGMYAGDHDMVRYLSEVRKHAGLMVPGPVQAAAVAAWNDDADVEVQRGRYRARLERLAEGLRRIVPTVALPRGGFYLWVEAPDGDAWGLTLQLARDAGIVASPGEFYGDAASGYIRLAVVRPDAEIELVVDRLLAVDAGIEAGVDVSDAR